MCRSWNNTDLPAAGNFAYRIHGSTLNGIGGIWCGEVWEGEGVRI